MRASKQWNSDKPQLRQDQEAPQNSCQVSQKPAQIKPNLPGCPPRLSPGRQEFRKIIKLIQDCELQVEYEAHPLIETPRKSQKIVGAAIRSQERHADYPASPEPTALLCNKTTAKSQSNKTHQKSFCELRQQRRTETNHLRLAEHVGVVSWSQAVAKAAVVAHSAEPWV